jgi:hypothetical protein
MYILNYIYFIILTAIGYIWLTSKGGYMTNPLNRSQKMWLDGPERFWVLTFSTGLVALSAPGVLDLMAIRLLALEVFCVIGLFLVDRKPVWSITGILYIILIAWLLVGLFYTSAPDYGIRVIMKYIYPLLIMSFASAAVRDGEVFIKAGVWARIVALLSLSISVIPFLGKLAPGVFWYVTARAINYISICVFSLSLFYFTNERKKNFLLSVLFIAPCLIWVFRTSIMGTAVALMTFFFFKYRIKSLPFIAVIFIAGIIAVFTIPSLKEKMFNDDSITLEQFQNGEITKDDINSNARFAMWEHLENRFYKEHKLTGSGTGSVQNYMYSNYIFGGLQVPHSDFVQMMCDNGLIALILYLAMSLSAIIHSLVIYDRSHSGTLKICAITAGSSMAGVLITLYSDNVVNYSMATLSMPFGFYGMALGLWKAETLKYKL